MNKLYDVCVIGGGAAGMSAALGAINNGAKHVILLERDIELGGILQQCIHNGFGLHTYKQELTGPSYTERVKEELLKTNVEIKLETTVLRITPEKKVHLMNKVDGYQIIESKSIIVSTGCRERNRHQIEIPGKRLAGIMTAGLAQRYLNIDGYLVGRRVLILGSGDIGLIMARRLTLEGAKVLGVVEIMSYSNGLNRNIVQCLHDFNIPLYLSHTVTQVKGNVRLEEVTIAKVDENFNTIEGTEKVFDVDTLLLSVGLIPENNLLKDLDVDINPVTNGPIVDELYQTSKPGIFSCGNSLHVHDLVDYVSEEAYETGKNATLYSNNQADSFIKVNPTHHIRYVIPNKIYKNHNSEQINLKFRVIKPIEKGNLLIKVGESIIKRVIKKHLIPSEMISITLEKSLLVDESEITLELEEDQSWNQKN